MSLREKRIAELEDMLAARTDAEGRPAKGYRRNVEDIRAELKRLRAMGQVETAPAKDPNESA